MLYVLSSAGRVSIRLGVLVSTLIAVSGCGSPATRISADHDQQPIAAQTPEPTAPDRATHDWSGAVTVARLVAAAQNTHPNRSAIAATQAAAAAQVSQAGAWDNPELTLHLGRTRPQSADFERDQPYGGSLSQRLSWWGKRNARVTAARSQQQAAEAEGHVSLLTLRAEVRRAAITYAAAVEAAAQSEKEAHFADELAAMTTQRLAAGEADRASVARATLEASMASLHRAARHREVAAGLAVLRTWCDSALPADLFITDALTGADFTTDAASLLRASEQHPQLRAVAEVAAAADASVQVELQSRIPDVTIGVFADREAEKDTYGLTVGFELPLWNHNEAGIAAAEAARAQAQAAARTERLRLTRDLVEALGAIQTAQGEVATLVEQVVPASVEMIQLRTTAYQAGDGSLTELLEARRAANVVQAELRDARRRAALALVDLGVAVGDPSLSMLSTTPPQP